MRQHYSGFCAVLFARAEHYAEHSEPLSLAKHRSDREEPMTNNRWSATERRSSWGKAQSAAHLLSRVFTAFALLIALGLTSCQSDVIEQATLSVDEGFTDIGAIRIVTY